MSRYSVVRKRGLDCKIFVWLSCVCFFLVPALCVAQNTSYTISTFAGSNSPGYFGDGGPPTSARLNAPVAIALDSSHNLYIADQANNRIRKVAGGKISTVAGIGTSGYLGDGAAATSASLSLPFGVRLDSSGNIYISDYNNHVIRKVDSSGTITTIVGNGAWGSGGDGGPALSGTLNHPAGLAIGAYGSLYIADSTENRVRMVASDGTLSTAAGNGWNTYQGDDGPGPVASVNDPHGVAVDAAGNLYIADSDNHRIRRVGTNGTITTVAGTGTAGFSGDGGPATSAQLYRPWDVALDAGGNLYIADANNNRIRVVSTNGIITTVAGTLSLGYLGDGGPAAGARLNSPTGVVVDSTGLVYVADSGNNVIRLLTPTAPSINAGGVLTVQDFGGFTSAAPGSWIEIYGTNLAAGGRSWNGNDFKGVNAPTSLDGTSVTIGGQAAYVGYISGGQVNVQVPSNVATGSQPVVVKTAVGSTASYSLTINATQPGMLAPASFQAGGIQYLAALFTDGATYVVPPGAIPGVTSRRASAGDTIVIYGVGFGAVTPNIPAGQVVQQTNALAAPLRVFFGQTEGTVTYAGLAAGAVGLYQFNVVVPQIAPSDRVPVTFTLGGTSGTQTLYTAVQ